MKNNAGIAFVSIKTKYNTRVVTNSGFKSSEVKELLNMKKQKVMALFQHSDSSSTHTAVTGNFAQDGGTHTNRYASTVLYDGRSFAEVAKGCVSRKATYLFDTRASPLCGGSIDEYIKPNTVVCTENTACENSVNIVCDKTCVTAEDSDKMKIFMSMDFNKYLSSILIKSCHVNSVPACNEKTRELWKHQTDFNFGFILLGEFCLSDSTEVNHLAEYYPITTHNIIKQFKKPNYLGARLKVDSQLNLDEWKIELVGYWDTDQLIDLLQIGFPLDFNRNSPLKWEGSNHKSATDYPEDIEAYLREELQFKAIVGPFDQHPCLGGHMSHLF